MQYIYRISVICFVIWSNGLANACIHPGGHDFSVLDGVIWEADWTDDNGAVVMYNISVCQPLSSLSSNNPCGDGVAACMVDSKGVATSIGDFVSEPGVEDLEEERTIQLKLTGFSCQDKPTANHVTVINFKCGKTLGSPEFLDYNDCTTNFDWYTSVACKTPPSAKESKCYVYDADHKRIDLSPLTKTLGGHQVFNFHNLDFYINVCRDITPEPSGATSACGTGSASCLANGSSYKNLGHTTSALSLSDDKQLNLTYSMESKGDSDIPDGCTQAPSTVVTFTCAERGQGGQPMMISNTDCQYVVFWRTEYACPEVTLTSSTCQLNQADHGVTIDLTPLSEITVPPITGYNSDKTETYRYHISVCKELGIECPDENHKLGVAACQLKDEQAGFGRVLGKVDHQRLRYSDGYLTLTYRDGMPCHDNFHRMTVINFHCNQSAGLGLPTMTAEENCTYIFDWGTSYACVSSLTEKSCQVEADGSLYDLSSLKRTVNMTPEYWDAEVGYNTEESAHYIMLVNVCEELDTMKGLSMLCPKGSGICLGDRGTWKSLGTPGSPTFDPNTKEIEIVYTGGTECGQDKHIESKIRFICKPGELENGPVLMLESADGCHFDFEWETAAACAQNQATGNQCQLVDDTLGLQFDLRPLTKSGSSQDYYEVTNRQTSHDYYINVCAEIAGSPCNDETSREGMAACQRDTSGKVFNTGKASTALHYADGFLNLTYTDGDPYNSDPPMPRTTEIAFYCDRSAGTGKPEFVEERNRVYVFTWATVYACSDVPIPCIVVDQEHSFTYDLSSLVRESSESNWVTVSDEMADGKKRTFYLNVCHHLVSDSSTTGCEEGAGICELTLDGGIDTVSHKSLGLVQSGPQIDEHGDLLLVYEKGVKCDTDPQKNYTTKIKFTCSLYATTTSPRLLSIEDCVYLFEWNHEAACPVGSLSPGSTSTLAPGATSPSSAGTGACSIRQPSLEYTFSFKPLTNKDYTVTNGDEQYTIHVCGAVSGPCKKVDDGGEPAVCLGDTVLGEVNTELVYSEAGVITLTYEGDRNAITGLRAKVIIEIECDRKIGEGSLQFIEKDGDIRLFRFATSLACPPEVIECKAADDKGNFYDLSRLAKQDGNWEVVDTRDDHNDLRYYINVCRPVNPQGGDFCSGLVGGCQTSNGQSYNLGYLQGEPVVAESGDLLLHYVNGDPCHVGKENESIRRTIITFSCADTESDPVFIEETADCTYSFLWRTPLACPVQKSTGSQCKVEEPNFHTTFDLTSLTKSDGYYKVTEGEYEYWLNVCGPLHGVTGSCAEGGACQTKTNDHSQILAGQPSSEITYEDGNLRLVYENGKDNCHSQFSRQTIITFTCDSAAGPGHPSFIQESPTCQYLFEWHTSLACPPQGQIRECSMRDSEGNQYDLSPLRMSDTDYSTRDYVNDFLFYINVCGDINTGHGVNCLSNTAVCLEHTDRTENKFESIGLTSTSELTPSDNGVTLTYSGTHTCADGTAGSVVLKFICQQNTLGTEPSFLEVEEGCKYIFQWTTRFACPLDNIVTPPGTGCKTKNPLTDVEFDLVSLKGRKYTMEDGAGHTFDIRVCEALEAAESKCGSSVVASCHYETDHPSHAWGSGTPNDAITFIDGILKLEYSGGEVCHHNNQQRSTVINFICGREGVGDGKPAFVGQDDNCTYFISWHTEKACETQDVICGVGNDAYHYELESLVKTEGYYSAIAAPEVDGDEMASYYINLCRPLNPIQGALCPPKAAVCKVNSQGQATGLGEATHSPELDSSGQLSIMYDNGDVCEHDKNKRWRSKILFTCEPGLSTGTPILEAVNAGECLYIFSWPGNFLCDVKAKPDVDNDCKYVDPRTQHTFDFNPLKLGAGATGYEVKSKSSNGGSYYVNVCGAVSLPSGSDGCASSSVCLLAENQGASYGMAAKTTFISEQYEIKMVYGDGGSCVSEGSARQSTILFECDLSAIGKGSISLFYEDECSVIFKYYTALACVPVVKDCIYSHAGQTYDLEPLSIEAGNWNITDSNKNRYWFNLCQGVHSGPPGCPNDAAACWQADGSTDVSVLGRVRTQTISTDNHKNIVLEYSGGNAACRDSARSERAEASFRVYLSCHHGVGKPTVISSSDKPCLFEIEWKTVFACAERTEPVFAYKGLITDKATGLQVPVADLSGDRTYSLTEGIYKYVLHLGGAPSVDSTDCRGMAVCLTKTDGSDFYESLGEADTATYFIKDGILEAHYTSATPCDKKAPGVKAVSIIDFHCDDTNPPKAPLFVYKSRKCHHVFDWFTPAVCELADLGHNGGVFSLLTDDSGGLSSAALGAVVGITVSVVIVGMLVLLLRQPERRARVIAGIQRAFRRSRGYTSYSYSQLNQAEQEDHTLLRSSQGSYGAESGHLGNMQTFHDDSDEDILQL